MTRHDAYRAGELGHDGNHPGSPNYVEPAFDMSDAAANVTERLRGDLPVLVQDLAESRALLDWLAQNVDLPKKHLQAFRLLDGHAKQLHVACDRELDVLNGRAAA